MHLLPKTWLCAAFLGLVHGAAAQTSAAPQVREIPTSAVIGHDAGFVRMPGSVTGLTFTNAIDPRRVGENQILLNGSGVALGDIDGDGRTDLFFAALGSGNRLYRNRGGWRFEDMTRAAGGLEFPGTLGTGAVFADVEGDGDLDLLLSAVGGGVRLLLNDGAGRFSLSANSGLGTRDGAMSMALADIDADGDLDLYVANYRSTTIRSTGFSVLNVGGKRMIRPEDRDRLEYLPDGRVLEHGEPDTLYLNDGSGHFQSVSWTGGAFLTEDGHPLEAPPRDWSLTAAFRDLNEDGAPDLYVCGDFHSPDRIWINDGRGRFRALPQLALRNTPTFSMCVDFADVDRDGAVDFFVADMLERDPVRRLVHGTGGMADAGEYESLLKRPQFGRNVLQMGRGDGTFSEQAYRAGVEATGWTWSAVFLDVDLDGAEDLIVGTGNLFDTQDQDANARIAALGPFPMERIPQKLLLYPPHPQRKLAFRNDGRGRFEEMTGGWGMGDEAGIWHGMGLGDLDGDGDLDVVVNRMNGEAGVYRNEAGGGRIGVRLKGGGKNTRGIGARIEVRAAGMGRQSQEMMSGGRYLSGDDAMRVFASGAWTNEVEVEVTWRSGKRSVVRGLKGNRVVEIAEAGATATGTEAVEKKQEHEQAQGGDKARGGVLFVDESGKLGHRHYDEAYDDFGRQGMLAHRQSQGGPGVGWVDVNGDGREDLVVGSGKGGRVGWFVNRGGGTFEVVEGDVVREDRSGVVGVGGGKAGRSRVWMGSSGYEGGEGGGVRRMNGEGKEEEALELGSGNVTALALGDLGAGGGLRLFVGMGAEGGRYPEAGRSRIFEERGGKWVDDEVNSRVVGGAGLVNGAVWTDLDGDGNAELVLAVEWGPVRVYGNRKGVLEEKTKEWGTEGKVGWWRGVTAVDVNGDGRMDVVAGNWGSNTKYDVKKGKGPRLYWGDLGGQGQVELVEARYEEGLGKWVPERDLMTMSQALPWLRAKYGQNRDYAVAGVEEMLGERRSEAKGMEANWLGSTVFVNRGNRLEAVELPEEAQVSPVSGVSGADVDGDGAMDLVLGQNFFAEPTVTSRSDAGRGLVLKGDGMGGFRAMSGQESGVEVYGEQRGVAVGDYDEDGRVDVVMTQNGAGTKLYRNVGGKAGIRVKLKGREGNEGGLGAVVRWVLGGKAVGPAQEVHGGSGWWSQDSGVLVFARPEGAGNGSEQLEVELEVRWPGGRVSRGKVAPGQSSMTVDYPRPE